MGQCCRTGLSCEMDDCVSTLARRPGLTTEWTTWTWMPPSRTWDLPLPSHVDISSRTAEMAYSSTSSRSYLLDNTQLGSLPLIAEHSGPSTPRTSPLPSETALATGASSSASSAEQQSETAGARTVQGSLPPTSSPTPGGAPRDVQSVGTDANVAGIRGT